MNTTVHKGSFLLAVDTGLVLSPLDLSNDLGLSWRLAACLEADSGELEAEEMDLEAGQQRTEVRAARVTAQQTHDDDLGSENTEKMSLSSQSNKRNDNVFY